MKKNLDMIAANEVGHDKAFDCEDNQLIVLSRNGRHELGRPASSRSHAARQPDRRRSRGARRRPHARHGAR